MASLPTSDVSSPSSSPLPDRTRDSAHSPSPPLPRSAVPTAKQPTPQPATDVATPTHPATHTIYSQFTQPLEMQKSAQSCRDSVEEVLSESLRSNMSDDLQQDVSVGTFPSALPHQEEKLLSERYTTETFEKSSHLSPSSSSHKAEPKEEEEHSSLGEHETGAEEHSGLGEHETGAEEHSSLGEHETGAEEHSSLGEHETGAEEHASLGEHETGAEEHSNFGDHMTKSEKDLDKRKTGAEEYLSHRAESDKEPSSLKEEHTAGPEPTGPSSIDVHTTTGPEERISVQKDVTSKIRSGSVVLEQSKDRELTEVLEEEIEEEEEVGEEDDDQFYSIPKKVEMRHDEVQDVETKGEEPMTGKRDEKKVDTYKPETVLGIEKKGLLEEEQSKDEDSKEEEKEEEEEEVDEEEEEEEEEEIQHEQEEEEEEEIQHEQEEEEEEEKQAITEVESKQSADNTLQLIRGRDSTNKGLTTLEHGPEAPRAKSPMGVEAAVATQISLEIAEDGPVSPELAGDVGSNQHTAPSSASMPSVTTLPPKVGRVKENSVAMVTEDLVQELANEAFETMYQLFRSRHGRTPHGQLEEENGATAVVAIVKKQDVTLTLEQKADKITDDLLALLVRSESMYINGLLSAREVPDRVTSGEQSAVAPSSSPPLSPLHHQHTFEANIHMPCPARHPGGDLECAVLTHLSPSGAHPPTFDIHSPPPDSQLLGVHPLPSEAHPPQPQAVPPPQAELASRSHTPTGGSMVNSDRQSLNTVCEYAWHTFHLIGVDTLHALSIHLCPQEVHDRLYDPRELGEDEARCRQHYVDLVYNVALEMIKELHPKRVPEPVWSHGCTKGGKLVARELKLPVAELALVQNMVHETLTTGRKPPSLSSIKFLNGMKRPGGREIDFVDALLIKELRDEEPSWIDYSRDETQVKIALADSILDDLIKETVCVLIEIDGRRDRRR